ncbi:hypothetical protein V8F20_010339 [Naviculisporaceae sp. PSN 640]
MIETAVLHSSDPSRVSMDPFTAIGLVSGVLTFVSFGTAVIKGAMEVHRSSSGSLEEIRTSEGAADELRRLTARLRTPQDTKLTLEDRDLCVLADESRSAAEKLLKKLDNLKPDNRDSKRQSLWASIRSKLHEKDRKDLEEKLKDLRSRLQIQLVVIASRHTGSSLRELIELVKANTAKLEDLQHFAHQLEQGVEIADLSESAKSQIRALVTLPDHVTNSIAQQRVLNALHFDEMHGRHDFIEHAHSKTFRWLMHPSPAHEEATAEKLWWLPSRDALALVKNSRGAHKRFTEWLESGNGIFHISGKLGSGKSTLMKYLGDEAKGSSYLRNWADGRKLIFAQFYFWRHGTEPRQRSLAGLRRALLHDILQQCPELIPAVLSSECWERMKSIPHQVGPFSADIEQDEADGAFDRLVSGIGNGKYKNHCFCFFIDGLDEYEETKRNDYTAMAELLNQWAANSSSSNAIKLCVSSRDYNAFRNAFLEERRLHLHELTAIDMEVVVRDGLKQISDLQGFSGLVREILTTAQGIFQWVTVVVAYLRDQIESSLDDATELITAVRKLPTDIYALYKEVLRLLPDTARAYRTFAMVCEANALKIDFSVYAYSFFHRYESDNGFIMRDGSPDETASGIVERTERGKKLLRGCSRGLLEPFASRHYRDVREIIRFTHRSVADFLEIEEVVVEKRKHLEGFRPLDALSQMFLADLRMVHNDSECDWWVAPMLTRLLRSRCDSGLDIEPYDFLEALDTVLNRTHAPCSRWKQYRRIEVSTPLLEPNPRTWISCAGSYMDDGRSDTAILFYLTRPLYLSLLAASLQYSLWKIMIDRSVTDSVDKVALLTYCLFSRQRNVPSHDETMELAIMDRLHGEKLLAEPTCIALCTTIPKTVWAAMDDKELEKHVERVEHWVTPRLTAWQHFLQSEWKSQRGGRLRGLSGLEMSISSEELDARFAKRVLWFLRRGADPAFATKASVFKTEKTESETQRPVVSVDFYFRSRTADGNNTEVVVNDTMIIEEGETRRRDPINTPSLREWILDLKVNDETKQEMLQLLPATSWYEQVARLWRASYRCLYDGFDARVRVPLLKLSILPLIGFLILYCWIGLGSVI